MSAVVVNPPEMDIDYPEGELVPEAAQHSRRRREIVTALESWLDDRDDADRIGVCDNINIYYRRGDNRAVVAPDVAVAFGVNAEQLRTASSYLVWEVGAAPAFVLEIASPSTLTVDDADKPAKYAALGAVEYWHVDPTGGELFDPPLRGGRLTDGHWQPITVTAEESGGPRGRSEVLGLDLCWQHPKLRLYNPATRMWLHDYEDSRRADRAARARAELEAARAERAEAELAELREQIGPHPPPADGDGG